MLTVMLFLVVAYARSQEPMKEYIDPNAPVMTFKSLVYDYGTIAHNSDGICEFKFTNTGKSPLILSNVQGSCGCIVPTWPKEPIKPGASEIIKVRYDTGRVGAFEKTLTITSNASIPSIVIKVKGKVLPDQNIDPVTGAPK